jgi:hypothetical protein
MNANKLADKLMSSLTMEYDCDEYMEQAATMLRQQQAEIGFYKQDADKYKQKCASQQAEIEALKIKHDAIACSSCVCGFIKTGKAQEK